MPEPPPPNFVLRGFHIRAARALLDWSQATLAEKSMVARHTISRMERNGRLLPQRSTAGSIRRTFEEAGIIFERHGVFLTRQTGSI